MTVTRQPSSSPATASGITGRIAITSVHGLAVRTEAEGGDRRVQFMDAEIFPTGRVPKPERVIVAAGGEESAIGTEDHDRDAHARPRELVNDLLRGQVPNEDGRVR